MSAALSVDVLRSLPFTMTMHLNCGSEHHATYENEEYGLFVGTTTKSLGCKIVRKALYAKRLDDHEVDLLAADKAEQLARFCEAYNAAAAGAEP